MSHPVKRRSLALFALTIAATGVLGVSSTLGLVQPPAVGASVAEAVAQPADAQAIAPLTETAPAFSGDEAHRHVRALAGDIGVRAAGSENQARAAEYLADQLRQLGYWTELQPFPITSYDDRGSTVTIGGAGGSPVGANTLQYSVGGAVEAEVVDGGLGRAGELAAANVRGKIALIERGEIRFNEKVANAASAGAVGAIIFNNQAGSFSGSLIDPSTIPVAGIPQAEGRALLDRLGPAPVVARLAVDASTERKTAQNVVAIRPGGPETILIGGHFDGVPAGPGANDNASGTATVLELARVMAQRPTPFTLKFALFDAEEIGLLGSAYMVSQMTPDELRSIRAMINLDMVGVGNSPQLGGDAALVRLGQRVATGLGQPSASIGEVGGGSDHASFLRAGVPALFVYRANDPNYHSPNDRAEYVDPDHLAYAGQVVLGVVDALANER